MPPCKLFITAPKKMNEISRWNGFMIAKLNRFIDEVREFITCGAGIETEIYNCAACNVQRPWAL